MSRKSLFTATIVAGLMIGWAVSQHVTAADKVPAAEGGPSFVVAGGGATPVLLDSNTGQTWALAASQTGESVWLPIKRLTGREDVKEWFDREMLFKRQVEEQASKRAESEAELRRQAVKD